MICKVDNGHHTDNRLVSSGGVGDFGIVRQLRALQEWLRCLKLTRKEKQTLSDDPLFCCTSWDTSQCNCSETESSSVVTLDEGEYVWYRTTICSSIKGSFRTIPSCSRITSLWRSSKCTKQCVRMWLCGQSAWTQLDCKILQPGNYIPLEFTEWNLHLQVQYFFIRWCIHVSV